MDAADPAIDELDIDLAEVELACARHRHQQFDAEQARIGGELCGRQGCRVLETLRHHATPPESASRARLSGSQRDNHLARALLDRDAEETGWNT